MNKAIITIMTVVLVVGVCNVPSLYALVWDSGYHEFTVGYESEIDMFNDATADITGGEIGILALWDTSSVFVYEPSEIDLLRPSDSSTANVYGGTIGFLFAINSSNTNVRGGSFDWLEAVDLSEVYLYVGSYELDPTGGEFNAGLLTGNWLDSGGSFSINLVTDETIDHLNFVPEPSTISLFAIGTAIFRCCVRKKTSK